VPAIHRNRAEIRQIFLDAMPGVDPHLTDEPRVLAMAARAYLRRTFRRVFSYLCDDPRRPDSPELHGGPQ